MIRNGSPENYFGAAVIHLGIKGIEYPFLLCYIK